MLHTVGLVRSEDLVELQEAVGHQQRIQRLSGASRVHEHHKQMILPEDRVRIDDLVDIAEDLLVVDVVQQTLALQRDQAVAEQVDHFQLLDIRHLRCDELPNGVLIGKERKLKPD